MVGKRGGPNVHATSCHKHSVQVSLVYHWIGTSSDTVSLLGSTYFSYRKKLLGFLLTLPTKQKHWHKYTSFCWEILKGMTLPFLFDRWYLFRPFGQVTILLKPAGLFWVGGAVAGLVLFGKYVIQGSWCDFFRLMSLFPFGAVALLTLALVTKVSHHVYVLFAFFLVYVVVCCRISSYTCDSTNYVLIHLHIVYTDFFFWKASPINQNMLLHCLHGFFERYHLQTWRMSQKTQQMCGVFIGLAVFESKSSCCTETTCIPWKSKTMKIPLKKIIVPGDLFFVIGIFHQKFE